MKGFKLLLRIWIGIASVLGFLGGWSLLAHANKPAPLIPSSSSAAPASDPQLTPLPTLAPLPSFNGSSNSSNSNGLQSFQVQPQVQVQNFPPMRTAGS